MQKAPECERGRADVTVEVQMDHEIIYHHTRSPRGVVQDGPAITMERLETEPGNHRVTFRLDDNDDGRWNHVETWTL